MKTTAQWLLIKREREFTLEERQELFGDASYDQRKKADSYDDELVRRFDAGLPLSRACAKKARRLKREGKAE